MLNSPAKPARPDTHASGTSRFCFKKELIFSGKNKTVKSRLLTLAMVSSAPL
jgi:hypothetical protein